MKRLLALLTGILLMFTDLTYGQDKTPCNPDRFEDALVQQLTGSWFGSGTVGGDKVGYNITAQWVLNHQFVEMNISDTAQQLQYTAKVLIGYDCDKKQYIAHWMDNFGGQFSETLGYGITSGPNIEFKFNYPQGTLINKFIFDKLKNSWRFYSTTKDKKGGWAVFGDIYLQKK